MKYIRSHTFFRHPDYSDSYTTHDIGLIKLEHSFERREPRDGIKYVPNIICLPVRGFRLKGTQRAKMAGSGPYGNRVKTGSTRVKELPGWSSNQEFNDFGTVTCPVSYLSPINLVQ